MEVAKAGRLPDGVIPSLINGSSVMDFTWDPFNDAKLYCGQDDGNLNVWTIPDGGLTEPVNTPDLSVGGAHGDKLTIVKCNPMAEGIVATAGQDHLVKIWHITATAAKERMVLTGHGDQIFSIGWSLCGRYLATACKDGKIR